MLYGWCCLQVDPSIAWLFGLVAAYVKGLCVGRERQEKRKAAGPEAQCVGAGCDVLWGGCPMVTLPLERMASRVAASLCYATGLGHEMVVSSQQEYEVSSPQCHIVGLCSKELEEFDPATPRCEHLCWPRIGTQMLLHPFLHFPLWLPRACVS